MHTCWILSQRWWSSQTWAVTVVKGSHVRYDQPTNSSLSIGNAAVYIFLLKSCKKKKKLVQCVNMNRVNVKGVL